MPNPTGKNKKCRYCGIILTLENIWSKSKSNNPTYKYNWICKSCFNRKRREENQKIRQMVQSILGGKCSICGESDWRCLQIDHINGGGKLRRKNWSKQSSCIHYWTKLLNWLKEHPQQKEYQLLCANHNIIKRWENKEGVGERFINQTVI